jgi:predicted transposase/invertase (TIGR01784 family)
MEGRNPLIRKRLKPKNDFIFKRLFGEEASKEALISLLNAILKFNWENPLIDLKMIENKKLLKEHLKDKTGRIDIRAETLDHTQINIEVQLTNEHNMDRRTLFYFGKLFLESIKSGDKYQDLKKTITINILDFNFLPVERFHSTFHLYEDHEKDVILTDVMEIHFIEYPKFRNTLRDMSDPLHRWLLFLEEQLPEDQLKELMDMDPIIRKTEERLEWLSSDEETQKLFEYRENARIDYNSKIYSAKEEGIQQGMEKGMEKGIEKGREEEKREIAKKLLQRGMDVDQVAEISELPLDEVKKLV